MKVNEIKQLLYHNNPLDRNIRNTNLYAKKTMEEAVVQNKQQQLTDIDCSHPKLKSKVQILTLGNKNQTSTQQALKVSDISNTCNTPIYTCVAPKMRQYIKLQDIDQELFFIQKEKIRAKQLKQNTNISTMQNLHHQYIKQLNEVETMLLAAKYGAIKQCYSPDNIPELFTKLKQQSDKNNEILLVTSSDNIDTLKNLLKKNNTPYTIQGIEKKLDSTISCNCSSAVNQSSSTSFHDQNQLTQLL